MEPVSCEDVACARLLKMTVNPAKDGYRINMPTCIGATCSQWVPTTHGSPPVENVGVCADNGKRLMIDRSKP